MESFKKKEEEKKTLFNSKSINYITTSDKIFQSFSLNRIEMKKFILFFFLFHWKIDSNEQLIGFETFIYFLLLYQFALVTIVILKLMWSGTLIWFIHFDFRMCCHVCLFTIFQFNWVIRIVVFLAAFYCMQFVQQQQNVHMMKTILSDYHHQCCHFSAIAWKKCKKIFQFHQMMSPTIESPFYPTQAILTAPSTPIKFPFISLKIFTIVTIIL